MTDAGVDPNPEVVSSSLRWSGATVVVARFLILARGLLLARLVGPQAFGIVAGVVAFTTICTTVAEVGLGSYLTHRGHKARTDAPRVTRLGIVTGVLGTVTLAALAVPIGRLYDGDSSSVVALALAPTVLAGVVVLVVSGLLRAEFRFRVLAVAEIGAAATGLVVGVGLAVTGADTWALVAAVLASQVIQLGVVVGAAELALHRRPAAGVELRPAVRFGWKVAAGGAVWTVALQADNAIVGGVLGASALGLYAFAYTYGTLPGLLVGSSVGQVAFPVFAHRRDQGTTPDRDFREFVRLTATLILPLTAIGVALTRPAVELVLGDAWRGAIEPLRWLLVVGALRGLFPTDELLRSVGRTDVELRIGLVAAPAVVVAALVGTIWSIEAVALGILVVLAGCGTANVLVATRLSGVHSTPVLLDTLRPALLAALAGAAAAATAHAIGGPDAIVLVAAGTVGILIYLVAVRVFARPSWEALMTLVTHRHLTTAEPA
ncbi:MAG: oligosaccharide flippase family protein [Acidimicrobiia bacterium]